MTNIEKIAEEISGFYPVSNELLIKKDVTLPQRDELKKVINDLRSLLYPAYFSTCKDLSNPKDFSQSLLTSVYYHLKTQVTLALTATGKEDAAVKAEEITDKFFAQLPAVQKTLYTDAQATFEGDPAAKSVEEVIYSYPGLYAIFVYRVAHLLYLENVPFSPRMMTEIAHGKTGIDINPGATIGEYFFIDHGTGIVIGETAEIGNRVKLYQGVTLGALSPRKGQKLSGTKRHPTVKDNVTIYSGASILGGETIIGENAVIGGNTFITESVAAGARVNAKLPELIIK